MIFLIIIPCFCTPQKGFKKENDLSCKRQPQGDTQGAHSKDKSGHV